MQDQRHCEKKRIRGSDTLVLLIHGIQGTPSQFDFLLPELPDSVDYRSILLPGHGQTAAEFRATWDTEWKDYVHRVCEEAAGKYERIFFVGHSMGCLLGIDAQAAGVIGFSGMLLLAPPMKVKLSMRHSFRMVQTVLTRKKDPEICRILNEMSSVKVSNPLSYLTCLKPYIGLFKLIFAARKQLKTLRLPIVAVRSETDELVSPKSLAYFREKENCETMEAPHSGHYLYSGEAQKLVAARMREMLAGAGFDL